MKTFHLMWVPGGAQWEVEKVPRVYDLFILDEGIVFY